MEIKETTEDIIKSIIDMQEQQAIALADMSNVINAMRKSILNDKRVLLKKMIFEALDRGYTTPEENERISIEFESYEHLGGNGYIKDLYDNKYSNLKIKIVK